MTTPEGRPPAVTVERSGRRRRSHPRPSRRAERLLRWHGRAAVGRLPGVRRRPRRARHRADRTRTCLQRRSRHGAGERFIRYPGRAVLLPAARDARLVAEYPGDRRDPGPRDRNRLHHRDAGDIRLVAEDAKLAIPQARRGMIGDAGSHWTDPPVGLQAVAADLLLTGRTFRGTEAVTLGLVSRALPADEVLPAAMEIAEDMARAVSPASLALSKRLLWADIDPRRDHPPRNRLPPAPDGHSGRRRRSACLGGTARSAVVADGSRRRQAGRRHRPGVGLIQPGLTQPASLRWSQETVFST